MIEFIIKITWLISYLNINQRIKYNNHLSGGSVVKAWDKEVCSL